MSTLAELRKRLAQAQRKSSKISLSQGECVDILLKITSLKDISLYSSNDGMYLFTPNQVESEIVSILETEGGRAELFYIANRLDLNFNIIEKSLSNILQKHPTVYYVDQGVLMNNVYINGLINNINCKLNELGKIMLSDLSTYYSLSVTFLSKIFTNELLDKLEGSFNNTYIENDTYRIIIKRCLKAALLATFDNVPISQLASLSGADNETALLLISEIIAEYKNIGIIKSNHFIPYSYIIENQNEVINYFSSNGFISKAKYSEFNIIESNEYNSIKEQSIALVNVFIKKTYFDQLENLVNEAISHSTWRSLDNVVPPDLSIDDLEMLIKTAYKTNIFKEYCENAVYFIYQDFLFITKIYIDGIISISAHYVLYVVGSCLDDYPWAADFDSYVKAFLDSRTSAATVKRKGKKPEQVSTPTVKCNLDLGRVEKMLESLISSTDDILSGIKNSDNIDYKQYFNETEYSFGNLWNLIYDKSNFSLFIYDELIKSVNRLSLNLLNKKSTPDVTYQLSEQIEAYYNTFHYSYKGLQHIDSLEVNNPISIYICKNVLMKGLDLLLESYQIKSNLSLGDLTDKKAVLERLKKNGFDVTNVSAFYKSIVNRDLNAAMKSAYLAAEDLYENIRIPNKKNEKEYISNKLRGLKSSAKTISPDDHLTISHTTMLYCLLSNALYIEFPSFYWSIRYILDKVKLCKKIKCTLLEEMSEHLELLNNQTGVVTKKLDELSGLLLSYIKDN